MKARAVSLFVFLAALGALPAASGQEGEHIVVTGGISLMQWEKYKKVPHDNWWLNFVRASRLRIEELRLQYGPSARITWLVYSPAYTRRMREEPADMFGIIRSVEAAYGVKLVYFSRGQDVVDYLNSGQPRGTVPIANLDYFGHSNKACFMFDYSNEIDSASKEWLHEDELTRIRKGIFSRNAVVKSWGCHTAESMSKKWRAATGVPMVGAIGKTQYQTHILPTLSSPNGKWAQ